MSENKDSHSQDDHHQLGHTAPLWILWGTLFALLGLTFLTVATGKMDFGSYNIWIAMGIASVKSILVCFFFMHLWWDKAFNRVLFASGVLFVGLFIGLALLDTRAYRHDIYSGNAKFAADEIKAFHAKPPVEHSAGDGEQGSGEGEHGEGDGKPENQKPKEH